MNDLKTLKEYEHEHAGDENDGHVIIEEVTTAVMQAGDFAGRDAHERLYVVRVHESATNDFVGECVASALQKHPGRPANAGENEDIVHKIGGPCPACDCGGVLSTVTFPVN